MGEIIVRRKSHQGLPGTAITLHNLHNFHKLYLFIQEQQAGSRITEKLKK